MLSLNNLSSPGACRKSKRIGRGQGSGWGTQAGKGHKGQKARAGGSTALGFEGGQMPIYRRLPKRGFSNARFKTEYSIITLDQLQDKFENEVVNRENLISKGLLSGRKKNNPIKVLSGTSSFDKSLRFEGVSKFSDSALKSIESVGGKIVNTSKDSE